MHRGRLLSLATAAVVTAGSAAALVPSLGAGASSHTRGSASVCGPVHAGFARCSLRTVTVDGHPAPGTAQPAGYGPADLQSAYALPSATGGKGATVAIVDAYDDPTAANDLAVYRQSFGLPACGSGCFTKMSQTGTTRYPRSNGGWAQEISLDLDMVSATCPNCRILLVEASSASFTNLLAAEDYATAHANYVSNSWSGNEFSGETGANFDGHFNKPGKAITASTGDSGFGVGYPASSQYVVGVGGTSLSRSGTGWSESAWSGAGSGCSAFEPQPAWQRSVTSLTAACGLRAVADVSAVADPNTGVAVYDTFSFQGQSGWLVFGGTSVSSPLIASVFALSGNTGGAAGIYGAMGTAALNDPTTGSNGNCGSVLCNAGAGWDGPTGSGTPNGVSAF